MIPTGYPSIRAQPQIECLPVQRLELVEARAVDDSRDHLAWIELRTMVVGDEAVQLVRVCDRGLGAGELPRWFRPSPVRIGDDPPRDRECMFVRGRVVVCDPRLPGVDVGAAELLRGHVLAGRCLHERRAADEDRARSAHDHGLVAHRGDVRAARCARAHHDGDLRDPERRHPRLVEENPSEVIPVGKDLGLQRQIRAPGVDEVDAREPVLLGHLLHAQMLLDRQREIRPALDGGVVGDDRALTAFDDTHACHHAGRWSLAVVHLPGRERTQLEERGAGVEQEIDPLSCEELAAGTVALDRALAAAARYQPGAFAKLIDQRLHARSAPLELVRPLNLRLEQRHGWILVPLHRVP